MLKLKLQYFGHLMRRADSLEKILLLGKIEGGKRRGWQRTKWLDGINGWSQGTWVWAGSGTWWWTGRPGMLQSMGSQRVRHDWATDLNHFFWGLPLWPSGKESTYNEEMQVQSQSQKSPLEEEIAIFSSILAWRIPWREEPGRLQSVGSQRSGMTERLSNTHTIISFIL